MNILDGKLVNGTVADAKRAAFDPKSYHLIAEAFKHAYAQRTKLADPRFVPEVVEVNYSSHVYSCSINQHTVFSLSS